MQKEITVMNLYGYDNPQYDLYIRQQNEKKNIRLLSNAAGLCVMGYVLIQNIISVIILLTPLGELYNTSPSVQSVITIFYSVLSLLIPFGIAGFYLEKKTGTDVFKFNKPVSTPLMITAAALGFFVCLAGNYITSVFVNVMDSAGVTLSSPEYSVPGDLGGRLVYVISVAVVPALVEEFAIRGAVLQPLRRYGDRFAILASALVFAVLHGNLIQAPFALIAGVGIGYAVCITNSIWTGILIHFCNNFYAVATEFMIADITDEKTLNIVYYATMAALYAVTIAGSAAFVVLKKKRRLMPSFTALSEGKKMKAFVLTIPMIIGFIMMLYITSQYVDFR